MHYAELGLKGLNRSGFIKRLAKNLTRALGFERVGGVERLSGRLWVYPKPGEAFGPAEVERLALVPGVAYLALAVQCELSLPEMQRTAWELVQDRTYQTFAVRSRRVFKELKMGSQDVDREVGSYLMLRKQAKVQLKGAELNVVIEMLPEGAFVFVDKVRGPGGLPSGTGGVVVCLLSGGIDSPVAAYRMLRRGCRVVFVHFHSQPFLSAASAEKARELAQHLTTFSGRSSLYLVPFGELQREVVVSCPKSLRVVLYRRFMVRVAELIAAKHGAKALVTGECLGQVASQTLSNIAVVDDAAILPILRPLIGHDKQEIIDEAKRLGTFETSILPDQDCCQLFVPKDPETHARLPDVHLAETPLAISELCQQAVERAELVELTAHAHRAERQEAGAVTA